MYKSNIYNAFSVHSYHNKQRQISDIVSHALLQGDELSLKESLICLLYYCNLISIEAIYKIFHPSDNIRYLKNLFLKLKSDGLADTISLPTVDNNTRKLYCLTKKGYSVALSLLEVLNETDFKEFKYTPKTIHDYSAGLNTLSLVNLKNSNVGFLSEFTFTSDVFKKKNGASEIIRPDVTCRFSNISDGKEFGYVFVEQDMGTEGTQILLDKMLSYLSSGVLSRNIMNTLLFSFRNAGPAKSAGKKDIVGNEAFLSSCKKFMIDKGVKTLFSLSSCEDLEEGFRSSLDIFMEKVGILDKDNDMSYVQGNDLSLSDIDNYLSDLNTFCCPYVNSRTLKSQYDFSIRKRNTLIDRFSVIIRGSEYDAANNTNLSDVNIRDLRKLIYSGQQMFACSTELMLNYLDYLNPLYSGIYNEILKSIIRDYLGIQDNQCSYSVLSEDILGGAMPYPLHLRNTYTLRNGDTISFENSHDILAWYRVGYFNEQVKTFSPPNKHRLFVICDTVNDALTLAREYSITSSEQDMCGNNNGIYFIDETALRRGYDSLMRYVRKDIYYRSPIFVFPNLDLGIESRLYLQNGL